MNGKCASTRHPIFVVLCMIVSFLLNAASASTAPVVCAVDEDFEAGAPGWFIDSASTCATGDYVLGHPANTPDGSQIDGSHSGVSSFFTATNISAGVDDVDGGNCILSSPIWSVTNPSTLSVWYWHGQRDSGDDPVGDFFLLEVSMDGGASWTTLGSHGDLAVTPVWTEATMTIPAGSSVQLRMQCSDGAGAGDLVECGLDDVSICRNDMPCTTHADCDDGLFCNGTETCDSAGLCQQGTDRCEGDLTCNETYNICEGACGDGACSHSADFESGTDGWTQGNDTCTTGSFIRGTPDLTAWQVGGGNPGDAFFTQNNAGGLGSDDVDGGTCEALSPVIGCVGSTYADVSLDYFFGQRDAGDDANDGFAIEILNNGSVVDTLVSLGDVTNNPEWTRVTSTVANPGNIQIRARATDAAGPGDIVEAGLDNVLVRPECPCFRPSSADANWRQILLKDANAECPPVSPPWTVDLLFEDIDNPMHVNSLPDHLWEEMKRYCVYTFGPQGARMSDEDLDQLNDALPSNCYHPVRMAVSRAGETPSLAAELQPYLQPRFLQEAGAVEWSPTIEPGKQSIDLVLVDNLAAGETFSAPENRFASDHGATLDVFAETLLYGPMDRPCGVGESGECPVNIESQLAISFSNFFSDVSGVQVSGGSIGMICDLAQAIWDAVRHGADHTILNLSLGWHRQFGGQATEFLAMELDVRAVYLALQAAAAKGALVIAAAGNKPDAFGGSYDDGPLLPAAWEECRVLDDTDPNFDCHGLTGQSYQPLVYAAAGTRHDGSPLSNVRPDSEPPLVAYGDHALMLDPGTGELTETLTGSSVASLVVSAAAAAVWYQNSGDNNFSASQVMDAVYDNSACVDENCQRSADFCLDSQPMSGACDEVSRIEVRRVEICQAAGMVCPVENLTAPDLCLLPDSCPALEVSSAFEAPMNLYPGDSGRRWTSPQPDSNICPNCVYDPRPPDPDQQGIRIHGDVDNSFSAMEQPTLTCGGTTDTPAHYRLPALGTGRFDYSIDCETLACCHDVNECCEDPQISILFSQDGTLLSAYAPLFVVEDPM